LGLAAANLAPPPTPRPFVRHASERTPSKRRSTAQARINAMGREQEFRRRFKELDTKGTGQLNFNHVRLMLKKEKPNMSQRQAMILFSKVDDDGSGLIEFEEFVNYILAMELLEAKKFGKSKSQKSILRQWDGPEQLKVNGSWDRETRLALQEFLAVQDTPTANVVKPSQFVQGNMHASHIVVLQELLQKYGAPAANEGGISLACGVWTKSTTKALNQLLLAEGAPTALHIGDKFVENGFNKTSILALQEFLAMKRKGRQN